MKRVIVCVVLVLLFTLSSACSSRPSLQLINSNVSITNDESKVGSIGITEGDKKGQKLVPTALYYEFTVKNAGNKIIGGTGDKSLQAKIIPNDKLVNTSKEVVGFNIFNSKSYMDTGAGYGSSIAGMIKPKEEGKLTLYYELGVDEENPQVPLKVPSKDKLKRLVDDALKASLVVTLENEEIARFDLMKR
ncbi:MAG TPA: hypothetical protein DD429_02510 [Clostridiaceae bacterium]|nr:hypothetical protein [Clostridiaceae bacterium]